MNRNQYMKELERRLKKLPKEEYDRAMEYFEEYFAEAGAEHEESAIASLGTPQEAAEEILKEIALRRLAEAHESGRGGTKRRLSTFWIVLLSIGAFPASIIAIIALVCLLAVLVMAGFGILIAAMFLLALVITAFAQIGVGAWLMTMAPASGMVELGIGLFMLGACWLLLRAVQMLFRLLGKAINRVMKFSLLRKERK